MFIDFNKIIIKYILYKINNKHVDYTKYKMINYIFYYQYNN